MVGEIGFEPTTLWSQTRCATRLRYSPTPCNYQPGSAFIHYSLTRVRVADWAAPRHHATTNPVAHLFTIPSLAFGWQTALLPDSGAHD
jgi:hypothetical protein